MATVRQKTREIAKRLIQVKRVVCAETSGRVGKRSPVDTGQFRRSWTPSIGSPDFSNRGGSVASVVNRLQPGQTYYFSNGQPYARRLEYGWSRFQAPNGMVRITAAEFPEIVRVAVQRVL